MATLLYKLKLFDTPDDDGEVDESLLDDLAALDQLGAAEHIAGPLPQQDGTALHFVLFAVPALSALEIDLDTATCLPTEVLAVRWHPGAFDDINPETLREVWDAARE